jgi:hypothetical protein
LKAVEKAQITNKQTNKQKKSMDEKVRRAAVRGGGRAIGGGRKGKILCVGF